MKKYYLTEEGKKLLKEHYLHIGVDISELNNIIWRIRFIDKNTLSYYSNTTGIYVNLKKYIVIDKIAMSHFIELNEDELNIIDILT